MGCSKESVVSSWAISVEQRSRCTKWRRFPLPFMPEGTLRGLPLSRNSNATEEIFSLFPLPPEALRGRVIELDICPTEWDASSSARARPGPVGPRSSLVK